MRLLRHRTSGRHAALSRLRASALSLLVAGVAAAGLAADSANADAPVEGVWSFNGGKVAIKEQANGTFVGTVVSPTRFAQCTHPVGEEMWTQLTPQADGSYWGLHQWFFETEECIANPTLGPTAWRVLQKGETRFLRVCFSAPGSNSQPTIAADGSSANVTFECVDSARISALPDTAGGIAKYLALPDQSACLGRRRLRIRIRDPRNDPLAKVVVTLKSGALHRRAKLKRRDGRTIATLNLAGLSQPSFAVTIRLTTVLGHHLSTKRTYRLCAKGKRKPVHRN